MLRSSLLLGLTAAVATEHSIAVEQETSITKTQLVTIFAMSVGSTAPPVMNWCNTTVARVIDLYATVVAMAGGGYRIAKRIKII